MITRIITISYDGTEDVAGWPAFKVETERLKPGFPVHRYREFGAISYDSRERLNHILASAQCEPHVSLRDDGVVIQLYDYLTRQR